MTDERDTGAQIDNAKPTKEQYAVNMQFNPSKQANKPGRITDKRDNIQGFGEEWCKGTLETAREEY